MNSSFFRRVIIPILGFLFFAVVLVKIKDHWQHSRQLPSAKVTMETPSPESVENTNTDKTMTSSQVNYPKGQEQFLERPNPFNDYRPSTIEDPFCLAKTRGVLILPSVFLKDFYAKSQSWVALPQSLAKCFTNKSSANFYFFEYDPNLQIPWEPLVQMSGQITDVKLYGSYGSLKNEELAMAENASRNGQLALSLSIKEKWSSIESLFTQQLVEPWVRIYISKNHIEDQPSYWPGPPLFHPLAQFISYKLLTEKIKNKELSPEFIDTRKLEERKQFPLPVKSLVLKKRGRGISFVTLHPNKIDELKLKFDGLRQRESRDKTYVLVARDQRDSSAFNVANLMMMYGYKSIYILEKGAASMGGASHFLETKLDLITALKLHELKRQPKTKLLIVDCRNRGFSNGKIRDSVDLPMLISEEKKPEPDSESTSDDTNEPANKSVSKVKNETKVDADNLNNMITNSSAKLIVLYGSSGADERPESINALIKSSDKIYKLSNGYSEWSFYNKYKWEKEPAVKIRGARRNSPLPKRIPTKNANKYKIVPAKNVAKPAGVIPPELSSEKKNSEQKVNRVKKYHTPNKPIN